eukprot:scaffold175536_cov27-Prasinocladus_malaysianus.AAC.1
MQHGSGSSLWRLSAECALYIAIDQHVPGPRQSVSSAHNYNGCNATLRYVLDTVQTRSSCARFS